MDSDRHSDQDPALQSPSEPFSTRPIAANNVFPFLGLPAELRLNVYRYLFVPGRKSESAYRALSQTCRELRLEVPIEGVKAVNKYYKHIEDRGNSSSVDYPIRVEGCLIGSYTEFTAFTVVIPLAPLFNMARPLQYSLSREDDWPLSRVFKPLRSRIDSVIVECRGLWWRIGFNKKRRRVVGRGDDPAGANNTRFLAGDAKNRMVYGIGWVRNLIVSGNVANPSPDEYVTFTVRLKK